MASGPSNAKPAAWALVRHYVVLFSSDKDKRETNRVWHDGKLTHHTYNGKMFLYDEADVELADKFDTRKTAGGGAPLLADQSQLDIGDYLVEVQRFERVSKTDLTPLLTARETKQVRQQGAHSPVGGGPPVPRPVPQSAGRFQSAATVAASDQPSEGCMPPTRDENSSAATSTNGLHGSGVSPQTPRPSRLQSRGALDGRFNGVSPAASSASPRRGPSSPHPFKTPFKSPLKRQAPAGEQSSAKQHRTLEGNSVSKRSAPAESRKEAQ